MPHSVPLPLEVVILSNVRRFHESHKGEGRFLAEADKLFWRCSVQQTELHVVPLPRRRGIMGCLMKISKHGKVGGGVSFGSHARIVVWRVS